MDLPPPTHDPGSVRDLADKILAEPRYDRPPKSIPDRILEWFGEQIGKVLGSLVGSGAGTVVAWIVVLAAIGVVVYLIVRFGRVGSLPRPDTSRRGVMVELSRTPAEWRREAEALEQAGRWREALRCRYRALVGELVRHNVIPEQAGRTAGEYVVDVGRTRPAAAESFAAATALFEAAWYGGAATGPAESARLQALEADVLSVGVGA